MYARLIFADDVVDVLDTPDIGDLLDVRAAVEVAAGAVIFQHLTRGKNRRWNTRGSRRR